MPSSASRTQRYAQSTQEEVRKCFIRRRCVPSAKSVLVREEATRDGIRADRTRRKLGRRATGSAPSSRSLRCRCAEVTTAQDPSGEAGAASSLFGLAWLGKLFRLASPRRRCSTADSKATRRKGIDWRPIASVSAAVAAALNRLPVGHAAVDAVRPEPKARDAPVLVRIGGRRASRRRRPGFGFRDRFQVQSPAGLCSVPLPPSPSKTR